jgi:hypothetical protein
MQDYKDLVEVLRNEVAMKEEQIETTGVRERELQEVLKRLSADYEGLQKMAEDTKSDL